MGTKRISSATKKLQKDQRQRRLGKGRYKQWKVQKARKEDLEFTRNFLAEAKEASIPTEEANRLLRIRRYANRIKNMQLQTLVKQLGHFVHVNRIFAIARILVDSPEINFNIV